MEKIVVESFVEKTKPNNERRVTWKFNAHFEEDESMKLPLWISGEDKSYYKFNLGTVVTPFKIEYFDKNNGETRDFFRTCCKWNDSVKAYMGVPTAIEQGLFTIDKEAKKKADLKKILKIAIVVSVIGFLPAKCTINGYGARAHFKKGYEYYLENNYEEALKQWEKGKLKENTPKYAALNFGKEHNIKYPDLEAAVMWWYKSVAYRKIGETEKADDLEAKVYDLYKRAYQNYKEQFAQEFPQEYRELMNSNAAKKEKQQQQQQYNEFLEELSNCKLVNIHWLEYYGESGVTYKIAAVPYWTSNSVFWIDDGTSDKLAGAIHLSCSSSSLRDTFKDLAYTETPTYFYIKYSKYGKSELVYINY